MIREGKNNNNKVHLDPCMLPEIAFSDYVTGVSVNIRSIVTHLRVFNCKLVVNSPSAL